MAEKQSSVGQDIQNTAQKGGEAIQAAKTLTKAAAAAGSGNWVGAAAEVAKNSKAIQYILMAILIPIAIVLFCAISLPTLLFTDDGNDGSFDYTTQEGLGKTCDKIGEALASVYFSEYTNVKIEINQDARQRYINAGGYDKLLPVVYTGVSSEALIDIDTEGIMAMYSVQQESLYEKELKAAEENGTVDSFVYEPPTFKQGLKKIKEEIKGHKDLLYSFELVNTEDISYTDSITGADKIAVQYTYRIDIIQSSVLAISAFGLTETTDDAQVTKYRDKSEYLLLLLSGSYGDMQVGEILVYQDIKTIINDYTKNTQNQFAWSGLLRSPLDANWRISSPLGWRMHPIYKTLKYHTGVDYAVPFGIPIKSIGDGVVISAGWDKFRGNRVIVYHGEYNGNPLVSLSAHMSEMTVTQGEQVKAGDILGEVGSTGDSTGPHLHIELVNVPDYLNPPDYY